MTSNGECKVTAHRTEVRSFSSVFTIAGTAAVILIICYFTSQVTYYLYLSLLL